MNPPYLEQEKSHGVVGSFRIDLSDDEFDDCSSTESGPPPPPPSPPPLPVPVPLAPQEQQSSSLLSYAFDVPEDEPNPLQQQQQQQQQQQEQEQQEQEQEQEADFMEIEEVPFDSSRNNKNNKKKNTNSCCEQVDEEMNKDLDVTQDMFFEEDQSVEIPPTHVVEDFARRNHVTVINNNDDNAEQLCEDSYYDEKRDATNKVYIGVVICLTLCLIIILGVGFGTGSFLSQSSTNNNNLIMAGNDNNNDNAYPNNNNNSNNNNNNNKDATTTTTDGFSDINMERMVEMRDYILSLRNTETMDNNDAFQDLASPESLALQFLVVEDPLQLSIHNENDIYRIHQRYALLLLWYNSGPLWTNYTNWLLDTNECNWHGIQCDNDYDAAPTADKDTTVGRVVVINLENNNVLGQIPNDVGYLLSDSLLSLNLANNRLEGTIPQSLTQLHYLQELLLDRNHFTGSLEDYDFASSRSFAESITLLDLSANHFYGPLPPSIYDLVRLEFLILDDNQFTGTLSTHIGNLQNLQRLTVSDNAFTGSLPKQITTLLPNIQVLWFFNNSFSGQLPLGGGNGGTTRNEMIQSLSQLSTFDIVNNQITGTIPGILGNLPNLIYLHLGSNNFTGPLSSNTLRNKNLVLLNIEDNQLTGTLPETALSELTRLTTLRIGKNQFEFPILETENNDDEDTFNTTIRTIPPFLYDMVSLQELRINGLGLQGIVDGEAIAQLSELVTLHLNDNELEGTFPFDAMIASCKKLRTLHIGNNNFEGTLPETLHDLSSIRYFNIQNNLFTGEVTTLSSWYNTPSFQLKHIDLSNNRFIGPFPNFGTEQNNYESLGALTNLDIHTNGLQGTLPPESISPLYNLQLFDVSTNRLIGELPSTLTKLNRLHTLNLNLNYFTSTIPETIGDLQSLIAFRVHTNIVTDDPSYGIYGTLPTSVGKMTNLEILQVFTNRLTGTLPTEIGLCTKLTVLDFEYNALSGPVPQEYGNLSNLEELYISNTAVTGIVPTSLCVNPPSIFVVDCDDVVCSCCTSCIE